MFCRTAVGVSIEKVMIDLCEWGLNTEGVLRWRVSEKSDRIRALYEKSHRCPQHSYADVQDICVDDELKQWMVSNVPNKWDNDSLWKAYHKQLELHLETKATGVQLLTSFFSLHNGDSNSTTTKNMFCCLTYDWQPKYNHEF